MDISYQEIVQGITYGCLVAGGISIVISAPLYMRNIQFAKRLEEHTREIQESTNNLQIELDRYTQELTQELEKTLEESNQLAESADKIRRDLENYVGGNN